MSIQRMYHRKVKFKGDAFGRLGPGDVIIGRRRDGEVRKGVLYVIDAVVGEPASCFPPTELQLMD